MSEKQEKDHFWLYVGVAAAIMITAIALIKINESDKFKQAKSLEDEEIQQMNIRVLKDY